MKPKHQVHNLIILDESGSMQSIKSLIINGFNELVQSVKGIEEQFPEQEHLIPPFLFPLLGFLPTQPIMSLNRLIVELSKILTCLFITSLMRLSDKKPPY